MLQYFSVVVGHPIVLQVPQYVDSIESSFLIYRRIIISDRSKADLSLRFHLFHVQCCSIFKFFKLFCSL